MSGERHVPRTRKTHTRQLVDMADQVAKLQALLKELLAAAVANPIAAALAVLVAAAVRTRLQPRSLRARGHRTPVVAAGSSVPQQPRRRPEGRNAMRP